MKFKNGVVAFLCIVLYGVPEGIAQTDFRSDDNSYYWKNRKPFEGYWQQDIHYKMRVAVDDSMETVSGTEQLTYWNNSPDTLYEVYFHLYQNAFLPGSHLHGLRQSGDLKTSFGEYEAQGKGTVIQSITCTNGIRTEILDNTLLKLVLEDPLLPNTNTQFDIQFITYWDKNDKGNIRRRMKTFYHGQTLGRRFKHFDGVHWYPRIAVYDRKFGWTTDQHLGKEFYGDYGTYDVEITFPAKYVVEATGKMTNRLEVLPPDLRKELDITNFKTRRENYTGITEGLKGVKTWKFKAINVHDFAFTADPSYRIGEVFLDGIRCIALAQEENAHKWQPTANFVSQVVDVYNRDFGQYAYPKIVAADARDGMEYPMITLDGGNWPGHKYLIAHEVGHNWFFGMVGNNETYRASMDEGFTQFLTSWALKSINNVKGNPNAIDDGMVFGKYIAHASDGNTARLNIHSDHFNSAERHGGGYGQVYYKTATMLYNLQYVLGDDLFQAAMKNYFNQWSICHPYWIDFRNSIIHYTKVDLNWFFDDWIESTAKIDYELKGIKKGDSKGTYEIKIRRNGAQMPLDLTVTDKNGDKHLFHIPNKNFEKKGAGTILPKWYGWGLLKPEYTAVIELPAGIKNVEIDASGRMADINRLNNSRKGVFEVQFDKRSVMPSDFRKYYLLYRPDFWYNDVDGIKAGIAVRGGFNNLRHLVRGKVWYNTGVGAKMSGEEIGNPVPINYKFHYKSRIGKHLDINAHSRYLDGLTVNGLGFYKEFSNFNSISVSGRHMMRDNVRFVYHPELWMADRHDLNINLHFIHDYRFVRGNGKIDLGVRSSGPFSDFAYSRLSMEVVNATAFGKLLLRTRTYAELLTGQNINPANYLMLAGANEEDLMDNKFTRSTGIIPNDFMEFRGEPTYFHLPGGLNLRGYSGYKAFDEEDGDTFSIHYGTRGASVNAELDFTRYLFKGSNRFLQLVRPSIYLFGDAGMLSNASGRSDLRADAGVGSTWTIRFTSGHAPLVLRVDLPLFMNRVPATSEYFEFRYLIGLKKVI